MGVRANRKSWAGALSLYVLGACLLSGCGLGGFRLPAVGIAGKYTTGKSLLIKPRGIGVGEAIPYFEEVAQKDPFYLDTLGLLGRAYYYQGRYQDALQMLMRAVVVNSEDEIAWLTLSLSRLRLGDDEAGFENLKTGIALVNKVSKNGYRGYVRWDLNGTVRSAIRRTMLIITKDGLAQKEELIRASELVLRRIDDEEATLESEVKRTFYREDVKR